MEPLNPEEYCIITSVETIEGKRGKAKRKKWWDKAGEHSKLLHFEPFAWEVENADNNNQEGESKHKDGEV